ncbi:hypothetical protein ACFPOI_25620 [Nonomuraea angiospora]|uniref:Uncharacterized protein n=1 Tax=Nonomuraea angiospora TaxID=46172 RepID=A0ABR9LQA7_9ACTN|nr:hypothetical protein [Nonomuraea angiospora]MBE1582463.1 hypothetical protein [Nonomuraea angiospora]
MAGDRLQQGGVVVASRRLITTVGFVIVDPATGASKAVTTRGVEGNAVFQWTPDGRYLAADFWDQE